MLDGGVHFVGGARFLLAAAGEKVVDLSAFSDLLRKKLPPVDTLHSIWRLESGAAGTFVCSWSTEHKSGLEFEIVTTKGRVTVTPTSVVVTTKSPDGKDVEDKTAVQSSSGVAAEVETFARGIRDGKLDTRLAPGEVMGDLLVMESMLKSHGTLKTL